MPYGEILQKYEKVEKIVEKPNINHLVNAGVYVIEPEVISKIPKDTYYDMTTLFEDVAKINQRSCVYFLKDYWIDVGQMKELKQANIDLNITLNSE